MYDFDEANCHFAGLKDRFLVDRQRSVKMRGQPSYFVGELRWKNDFRANPFWSHFGTLQCFSDKYLRITDTDVLHFHQEFLAVK